MRGTERSTAASRAEEGVLRSRTPTRTPSGVRRRRQASSTPSGGDAEGVAVQVRSTWTPLPQGGAGTPPNLVWQGAVPDGRRASHICLHWLVYLLIVLTGVQGLTALLKALSKVVERVKGVPPLSPPGFQEQLLASCSRFARKRTPKFGRARHLMWSRTSFRAGSRRAFWSRPNHPR